ncbi:MAG: LON peptidase substrate-binding domain-containing protein [Planctomycetota bacterium]|nr:LON peptidase substrate-binding domain-containing protein [Planctomycetota bacterium]MDA1166253.1 LON peptidase substrate-binding domain-containing protein [Planctomycetota bacterium]
MTPADPNDATADFTGRAAIFPLPNVTLFPNVMLPLHIFEPRYRCMAEDVLSGDRFLALGLLKDGWENNYESKHCAVHDTVCLGKVIANEQLEDGRHFLMLQGLRRAQLVTEIESDLPYRLGMLELIEDVYPQTPMIDRQRRQEELVDWFRRAYPKLGLAADMIHAIGSSMQLGELCDVIAHSLKLSPVHAQRLLSQADVDQRSDTVLEMLKLQFRGTFDAAEREFPPGFSLN